MAARTESRLREAAFFASAGWPDHATVTMLAEAYDGDDACQLDTPTAGGQQVEIAEHLTVRDGGSP